MDAKLSYLERLARGLVKTTTPAQETVGDATARALLMILLDRSTSMDEPCGQTNRLLAAQNATIALVDQRLAVGADDQLAVIAFNERAKLVLPFTSCRTDRRRIVKAVRSFRADGGTSLSQPLILAEHQLPPGRRVHLVLLSDGHGGDPTQIAARLKQRSVVIETIGVAKTRDEVAEDALRSCASVQHGQTLYRFITDAAELTTYFQTEIANRLVKRSDP